MMRNACGLIASVWLVGACGSSSGKPSAPSAPTTAPPSITWDTTGDGDHMMASGDFVLSGLPAVSADGSLVLLPIQEVVAGPLAPNLALVEKGRDDHEVGKLVVMTVAEANGETAAPKDVPGANRWLAEQHQAHDWRPLTAFPEVPHPEEGSADHVAQGDVAVDWNEGHLTVTAGGKTVVDATHADWLAAPYKMACGDDCDDTCSNPSMLGGVAGDLAHRLLVVTIAYHGTDSCWEPTPQVHVVTW